MTAFYLLILLAGAGRAQVDFREEGFRVVLELVFETPPKELASRKMTPCQVARLPRVEKIIQDCGGKVLQPLFQLPELEYLAQVPDTKADGCVKELERKVTGVRVVRHPWERNPWTLARFGKDGRPRAPKGFVPCRVVVMFKDPKTMAAQAEAVVRRHGGFIDDKSAWGERFDANVPEGCEEAFSRAVAKEPRVRSAFPEYLGSPKAR